MLWVHRSVPRNAQHRLTCGPSSLGQLPSQHRLTGGARELSQQAHWTHLIGLNSNRGPHMALTVVYKLVLFIYERPD